MSILKCDNSLVNINFVIDVRHGKVLSDKSSTGKERPWRLHKLENIRLVQLYKSARHRERLISDARLFDLEHCADTLVFGVNEQNEQRLIRANFCRVRLCPVCQWRRSLKLFSQVNRIAEEILKREKIRFLFVTFTVKSCDAENLDALITAMNQGFKYLTSHQDCVAAKKFKQSFLGYIKAIEVTYNTQDKTYHPHVHCIFAVKSSYFRSDYMKMNEWRTLWQKVMKLDYTPQVDARIIKNGTAKAVAEVAKYPAKITPILNLSSDEEAVEVLKTLTIKLRKRRFVSYGGIMRTVKQELKLKDIEKDVDLVNTEFEDKKAFNVLYEVMYKFNFRFGCYIS